MANMTEYLYQLQQITEQNLSILKALNESFYTKSEHISAVIGAGDNKQLFAIPSFLCLEDKINTLQANFENLVNAPRTGEAAFSFDGDSRMIEVKGFSNTPQAIDIDGPLDTFMIDKNDVLKDFVTPNPYLKIDLSNMVSDIKEINIKKIILKNSELRGMVFDEGFASKTVSYSDIRAQLDLFEEDRDYMEYDTLQRLPLHTGVGYGEYTIESIVEDKLDNDFKETYVITIQEQPTYMVDSNTIEKYLQVGDELTNWNDAVLLTITDVNYATRTITAQVKSGMYVSLTSYTDNNADEFCKLKFRSTVDFNKEKYAKVTLEEDDNCIIFIAPVNNLNIKSEYGYGVAVDTTKLTCIVNGVAYNYLEYYNEFVNNIGDTLLGLTTMINNTINNTSAEEFEKLVGVSPELTEETLKVININEHLNNSEKLSNIRGLYSQKKGAQQKLATIQGQINDINNILQTNTFEDLNQNRQIYESQLQSLLSQKTETTEYVKSLVGEISTNANEAAIPLKTAKYRIRGYFDHKKFITDNKINTSVVKLRVQYRYRNQDSTVGGLKAIDDKFVFTEWNECGENGLTKLPEYGADNQYHFSYPGDNSLENEISFNQIDIPITQGEKVEMRVKAVYDLGYPFIECASQWSNILTIQFPEEFEKNVEILDIIEENNSEVKKNQLNDILEKNGTIKHVSDTLNDQDITFLHKPQSIASGFYTAERRVVPLYDKLQDLNIMITKLSDEVFGVNQDQPIIKLSCDSAEMIIKPNTKNTFLVQPYEEAAADIISNSNSNSDPKIVTKRIRMDIMNPATHTIKFYSIFPGNYKTIIGSGSKGAVDALNYAMQWSDGHHGHGYMIPIWVINNAEKYTYGDQNVEAKGVTGQKYSQLFYFRTHTPYIDPYIYESGNSRHVVGGAYVKDNYVMYSSGLDADGNIRGGGEDWVSGADLEDSLTNLLRLYRADNLNFGGAYLSGSVGTGENIKYWSPISLKSFSKTFSNQNPTGASLYPMVDDMSKIQIQGGGDGFEFKSLAPNESISVDLVFEYNLPDGAPDGAPDSIEKTLSLDIRTSLYKDPINFEFTIKANKNYNINDEIQLASVGNTYQPIKTN